MTDTTTTKTNLLTSGKPAAATAAKTSNPADAVFLTGDRIPDVSTLSADAFGALHSELDQAWDLEEFAGDLVAGTNEDAFVFTSNDKDGNVPEIGGKGSAEDFFDGDNDTSADTGDITVTAPPALSANVINGSNGRDVINGTGGKDEIHAFGDLDLVFGYRGNDEIYGGGGIDHLFGGRGRDLIYGGRDGDFLYGERGADKLFGGAGDDNLYGGGGNDLLAGGLDNDFYDGGRGIDTADFSEASSAITVALWDTGAQYTGEGIDTFVSIESVIGSDFNDHITGTTGDNRLDGGRGDDRIEGGPGNDYLLGGTGRDNLNGGTGNNVFNGGAGEDRASFSGSANGVVVDLSATGAQNTGEGIDTFVSIESVEGSSLGDLIYGNADGNTLIGEDGNDWIWGAGGNDLLFGGNGNDVLIGGAGNDYYVGANGADAFVWGDGFGDSGDDIIEEFEDGVDLVFVQIGFGITDFSDVTVETNAFGNAVANFTGGFAFGGSITFNHLSANQITADDFVFFA